MIKTALDTKECYAECHFYSVSLMQIVTNHFLILSVFLFKVIMLSVVAPQGSIDYIVTHVLSIFSQILSIQPGATFLINWTQEDEYRPIEGSPPWYYYL